MWAFGLLLALMLNDEMADAVREYQRQAVGSVDMRDEEAVAQAAVRMPGIAVDVVVGKAEALVRGAKDAGVSAAWSKVAGLLRRCFDREASVRASAMECEEELQQVYAALAGDGTRYPNSDRLPMREVLSAAAGRLGEGIEQFKPREREARYHQLVLGDWAKAVELLEEQLAEELRDALLLTLAKPKQAVGGGGEGKQPKVQAAWDVEAMMAALEAGTPAAEVVGANPSWLPAVGSKLAEQANPFVMLQHCKGLSAEAIHAEFAALAKKRIKLLPVLLDWVSGTSHLRGEGRAEGGGASVALLVAVVEQLQEVWAGAGAGYEDALSSCLAGGCWTNDGAGAGDGKRCCSHQLGSSSDCNPPFVRLCEEGAVEVVQGLLALAKTREAAGGEGVGAVAALMAPNPVNGATPLLKASDFGHAAVVEALLAHEATDVNQAKTGDGSTPLFMASQNGHAAVVEALLAHEATDVNQAKTGDGSTPLFIASYNGHAAVVEALLAHEATDVNQATTNNGSTPLFIASQNGHAAVVEALLAHEATDVNQARTDNGSSPLFHASFNGHAAVVEALLRHPAIKVDQVTDVDGFTPLIVAAYIGQQRCVKLLLDAGADRTITMTGSAAGATAVDAAKQQGHASIVALLGCVSLVRSYYHTVLAILYSSHYTHPTPHTQIH
jgi:ankyrin repeat protein